MKKKVMSVMIIIAMLLCTGCGSKIALPEHAVKFDRQETDAYISIIWDDKEYVPYCALEPKQVGACIGYYENDGEEIYVCELKGQSSDDWLVDTLDLSNCTEGMIYKEKHITDISDGLLSDYIWNQ